MNEPTTPRESCGVLLTEAAARGQTMRDRDRDHRIAAAQVHATLDVADAIREQTERFANPSTGTGALVFIERTHP